MKESYIEDLANHGGPEPCVGVPRGRSEALDRGARRPAIEPRKCVDWGADALTIVGRQHCSQRYSQVASRPHGVREPVHVCDLSMLENRESPRSPRLVDDAPPYTGRGVADRLAAGRMGNTEVVIP